MALFIPIQLVVIVLFLALAAGVPFAVFQVLRLRRERNAGVLMSYLAATASRGYPLAGALGAYAGGVSGRLRRMLLELADDVARGAPLSVALQWNRKLLPHDYVELIRTGEASGRLPEVFRVLARRGAARRNRSNRALSFAIYPFCLTAALGGVGALMFSLVYPKLQYIVSSFGGDLPWIFRIVPTIWGWSILVALALTALLVLLALPPFRGHGLSGVLDVVRWWLPFSRRRERYESIRLFAEALEVQLSGGSAIREALERACHVEVNAQARTRLWRLLVSVERGEPLSSGAGACGLFPSRFVNLLAMGEQAGDLKPVLREMVRLCDERSEQTDELLHALSVPVIVLVLGAGVFAVVLSVHATLVSLITRLTIAGD